jgi:hypothetical protein
MSTSVVTYGTLFFVSFLFGSLPFIGGLRALPRWIRIALLMIGLSFFCGAAFGVALNVAAPRLSPQMYAFLYAHKMIIFGVGIGIILLLLFSGEYFKALRELDAGRRKRRSDAREEHGHEHV